MEEAAQPTQAVKLMLLKQKSFVVLSYEYVMLP